MKQRVRMTALILAVSIAATVGGCRKTEEKEPVAVIEEKDVPAGADVQTAIEDSSPAAVPSQPEEEYEDAMALLIGKYGLAAEELEGLDVDAFARDYRLFDEVYTEEELREILADMRDYYVITPQDEIFSLLGNTSDIPEDGPSMPKDAEVIKIAVYENPGTLQKRVLFDLEKGEYYVDDAVPHELTQEQAGSLKKVVKEANVPGWEHYYERTGLQVTTASYGWKIVFLLRDGSQYVYGGYTEDMSDLPAGLEIATYIFDSIAYPE